MYFSCSLFVLALYLSFISPEKSSLFFEVIVEPCFEIFLTLSECNAFSFKPGFSFFTKFIISFSVGKLSFVMINPKLVLLISELIIYRLRLSLVMDYHPSSYSHHFNFNSSISTGSDFIGDEIIIHYLLLA
ncbi:hypothetical protein HYD89_02375 [Mycoplasmopsis bovis]|nr:hypothetical protein [Mycoplasmopsis bovis]QQH36190.1 hypothetical protein HYD89_02375 [Mycoplasmopsis bovis]